MLAYRTASKGLSGDRENTRFAGSSQEYFESDNELSEEEEDGWSMEYLSDSGVFDVLDEIRDTDYELRHCIRGCNTGCENYKDLGNYLVSLGEQLSEAGESVKYIG